MILRATTKKPRQVDFHRGSLSDLAVDADMAARLLHEAIDLAETKAGAMANLLSRKERLEHAAHCVFSHPAAGIAHTHHDVLAGADFEIHFAIFAIEDCVRR